MRGTNRGTDRGSVQGAAILGVAMLWFGWASPSYCQNEDVATPATLDSTIQAGEADAEEPPPRGLAKHNSFDLGFTTLRLGYGFLVDFATYSQDADAEQQVVSEPDIGLRDFRFMFKGRFKTKRDLSWTMGIMWDAGTENWHFRQTGLMIGFPEISSHFFIGRTKEGYSQYKYMVGYDIWTMERSPYLDAFVPIMADGIKWIGSVPKARLLWNVGWFEDWVSEKEKFNIYDRQLSARLVWLPVLSDAKGRLLHLGLMGRDLKPDDGFLQPRSRPEAYLAPYYVDTGRFPSDHAQGLGV
ncbi:MAG: hypothetical protein ACREF4_10645, partial [Gammaproteobacteria bacterium]